jgi:hypothetical protein
MLLSSDRSVRIRLKDRTQFLSSVATISHRRYKNCIQEMKIVYAVDRKKENNGKKYLKRASKSF